MYFLRYTMCCIIMNINVQSTVICTPWKWCIALHLHVKLRIHRFISLSTRIYQLVPQKKQNSLFHCRDELMRSDVSLIHRIKLYRNQIATRLKHNNRTLIRHYSVSLMLK